MRDLRAVNNLSGPDRDRAVRVAVIVGLILGGGVGCSAKTPANPDGAPVTITFLRHDNPNYRIAGNAFFASYMAMHPNVTIVDTTVDFHTLDSMLLGDLRRDQFAYDLV